MTPTQRKHFEYVRDVMHGEPQQSTEQEPVAFINVEERKLEWAKYMSWDTPTVVNLPKIPLYTQPQEAAPRQWVGLTLQDKEEFLLQDFGGSRLDAMDWAARRLKEKNHVR